MFLLHQRLYKWLAFYDSSPSIQIPHSCPFRPTIPVRHPPRRNRRPDHRSKAMCSQEVFGDYYRGCGHFIKAYYSGETSDCGSQYCYNSAAHVHKAPNCPCPRAFSDNRRIQSMFHQICDACKTAALDRLTRRG
ncbi:hypothetical protein FPV67DRAFT_892583 [Lyophyllum atratum]|nr:hypothetical protein FPV67DRAFT_892583 [Lyophyllum atratum]